MTDTVFLTYAFKASGATVTTDRTLPDRLAEVVNVKDFGTFGDNSHDDTAAIQAAFDAAFITSGTPNGVNSYLNRPVYFPAGQYLISGTLTLSQVRGGMISGAGMDATRLIKGVPSATILAIDGMEDSIIENLSFDHFGGASSVSLDLNYSSGAVGLKNVTIVQVAFGSGQYGLRVARDGNGGSNINLINVTASSIVVGISIEGDDCVVNTYGSGTSDCVTGIWVQAGCVNCYGHEFSGAAVNLDLLHDSAGTSTILGGRSETCNFIKANAGKVHVTGIIHTCAPSTPPSVSLDGTSSGTIYVGTCSLGERLTLQTGTIAGNPNLFFHDVILARESAESVWGSFTGKLFEYVTNKIFSLATGIYPNVPPNPGEGLTVNVNDVDTSGSALTWGATPSAAPHASGTFLFSSQPASSSTITLNGTVITFDVDVTIGASLAATLATLADFLNINNNQDAQIEKCSYGVTGGNTLTVKSRTAGTTNNSYTLAAGTAPASHATRSGATLSGGTATFSHAYIRYNGSNWTVVA